MFELVAVVELGLAAAAAGLGVVLFEVVFAVGLRFDFDM